MTSRERMLAAVRGERPDHVPLAFMIFEALKARHSDWFDYVQAQVDLGIDAVADMTWLAPLALTGHPDAPGVPVRFPHDVEVRKWKETAAGARYPALHKEYKTPCGTLSVAVSQTEDWEHGEEVPIFSDFLVPRCTQYLVSGEQDLPALRYLLCPPLPDDVKTCRELWRKGKEFAEKKGVLLANGWGVGADALGWLCGLENAVWLAIDRPDFLHALLDIIHAWNMRRMELMLEPKPDLFIRRAWYEGTSYWSPALFRQFLLPYIQKEVETAHQAGARYGYILTVGGLQFADLLKEAGIDILIGVDPVQDRGMDMQALKSVFGGKVALWGGINGFITVERGTAGQIREAVRTAMSALGPAGFVLSPVDNVVDPSEAAWRNVEELIRVWQETR